MKQTSRAALIALSLLLSLPGGAFAEESGPVGLLPFQGTQAAQIRQRVQNRLRAKEVDLIPLKEVSAVAKKTNGWAPRARKLGASLLVLARIRKSADKWIADVEVRNAEAKRVEKFRTSSTSSNKVANRIADQLLKTGLLPLVSAPTAEGDTVPEPDVTAPTATPTPAAAVEVSPEPSEPLPATLVVRPFTGRNASRVRTSVVRALQAENVKLTPTKEFSDKAKSMGADLSSDGGHVAPAAELGVVGLVEGEVSYEDGLWSAYIRLIDGRSAKVIDQHFYDADTSGGLSRVVREEVYPDFKRDVRKLKSAGSGPAVSVTPTVPDALAQQPSSVERVSAAEERKARRTRPAAIDIELDFRLEHRNFEYEDDLRNDLRGYELKIGPGIGTKLQWYPGAHFTSGVGAQFGIDFEYKRLFDFDSVRDDLKFPTASQEFDIAARWRYPVKRWKPFLSAGYGVHSFEIGLAGPPQPDLDNTPQFPSVKYRYARFATGFRVKAASVLAIMASIAYRWVFDAGGIESVVWFPQASAAGMDANLVFGFLLPKGFEIRLGGEYRRYWFDLNPVPPNPPYVAGGALDQYWTGTLGVAWRY